MNDKALSRTNPYLRNTQQALRNRVRSLASSTAIETGEAIERLEDKIRHLHSRKTTVTLA